ncbi:MAG: PH domain-containing protein [Planctomycetes bacterium]|nr:PH domain-containing protein [Planctomycetota bacterium]MBL7044727.1 PH domain-containing protein [Pirellulaceae bacterium]
MSTTPPDDQGFGPSEDPSPDTFGANESDAAPKEPSAPSTPMERFKEAAKARQDQDEDEQEDELWEGRYSSRAMIGKWILAGFITVALLVGIFFIGVDKGWAWLTWLAICVAMWGWFAMQLAYRKLTCKYRLTSQRFVHESGLLKRVIDRIEVIDIDDVSVEQRVVERILGVGTVKITSSDRSHPELSLRGIEKVKNVAGLIDDTRRKERRRRGLHIEAI